MKFGRSSKWNSVERKIYSGHTEWIKAIAEVIGSIKEMDVAFSMTDAIGSEVGHADTVLMAQNRNAEIESIDVDR